MPISKAKQINLLPQDEFQSSTLGRLLKWALSTFRVMVIITELVVMSAFLSRFWLDARNSDLNEKLLITKARISAYSATEAEFRSYQRKLSIAKNLYLQSKDSELLVQITKQLPDEISLTSVQRTEEGLQIKALSLSESAVAQFLVNLIGNKSLTDVNLSQVASSVDNSFATTFTITSKVVNSLKGGS